MLSLGNGREGPTHVGAFRGRAASAHLGMNVLLDECGPWPMHTLIVGHECKTAQQCGWGGITNGDLLRKAEVPFDAFITSVQNIRYQQNLAQRLIPILKLSTNELRRIRAAADSVQAALAGLQLGHYFRLKIT